MTSTEPVLRVVGLSKRFGPTVALDDVHLVAEPGQVHAIVGENGAGKSTLLRTVCGLIPAQGGSIRFLGSEILGNPIAATISSSFWY